MAQVLRIPLNIAGTERVGKQFQYWQLDKSESTGSVAI